jgi:hypothetical protein
MIHKKNKECIDIWEDIGKLPVRCNGFSVHLLQTCMPRDLLQLRGISLVVMPLTHLTDNVVPFPSSNSPTRCPACGPVGVHLALPSLRTHPHAQHCILACGLEACDAARRPRSRFRWPSSHITYFESPMHRITLENQKCTPDIMYQKIMKQCINLIILV